MKAIKLSLLLAFAMLATTASAQFVNSGNNATATQQGAGGSSFDLTSVKTSGWFGIFVSYNPSKLSYDIDGVDDIDFKGFTVGLMRGFSLTKKAPLYLEAGFDMFDENDVDNTWGLFQAGWHIGIAFDYNALHIGVDYGTDFNEICDKAKISTTSITVGVYI